MSKFKSIPQQPAFKMSHFAVRKLKFNSNYFVPSGEKEDFLEDFDIKFMHGISLDSKKSKSFTVYFEMKLVDKKKDGFKLTFNLGYDIFFETSEPMDEELIKDPLFKINAPAIAFPYFRSFVTNFFMNAGYPPLILPTMNFSAARTK